MASNIVLQYLRDEMPISLLNKMGLDEAVTAAAERIQAEAVQLSSKATVTLLSQLPDMGPVKLVVIHPRVLVRSRAR